MTLNGLRVRRIIFTIVEKLRQERKTGLAPKRLLYMYFLLEEF